VTSAGEPILYALDGGIARIRFNRPSALNAIDVTMAQHLLSVVKRLCAADGVRVVVLSGEGKAFMAGGDLQAFHADLDHADDTARNIIDPLHEALDMLARGDAPVIASLHGAVAGAGMSIALGADLAIASEDVKFNMAYARIGASLDGGASWSLPRLVGLRRAMAIALLSDPLDAAAALELGLINRIVPVSEREAETLALARRLAQGATGAYGRIRRLLRGGAHQRGFVDQLREERDAFAAGARTPDFAEGIAAFFDKRPPRFTGE
jgi:2-(1,2-epoxy-1,2-dihydrophenyl)acetyl-CoA isomerase